MFSLTFLVHPTLFSVAATQSDIWIMLQKILLSVQALRVLPSPRILLVFHATPPLLKRLSKSILLVFNGTQPLLQLSEQPAVHRPGPDDVSEGP